MAVVLPASMKLATGSRTASRGCCSRHLPELPIGIHGARGVFQLHRYQGTGSRTILHSSSSDMASNESDFDLSKYKLVEISTVRKRADANDASQWIIMLKIPESELAVNVYVGDNEGSSLDAELGASRTRAGGRPRTYDMMKNTLSALGARVTKVCITALVENTYIARVHYLPPGSTTEVSVDSRPSDALNMAVRFGAAVYVNKAVAEKMATPITTVERRFVEQGEGTTDIVKSCKEALQRYHDPTVLHKIQLQVAVEEERFEDAAKLRNEIGKLLSQDRTLSLAVAIESALEDKRWVEAAALRDQLLILMEGMPKQSV